MATQELGGGGLGAGWVSPTGTLYATGAPLSPRVRDPKGAWTVDTQDGSLAWGWSVHGSSDDEVWAIHGGGVARRQADRSWVDMGLPGEDPVAVHVFGPSDVLVLDVETEACYDCPQRETAILRHWDGVAWTADRQPSVRGSVTGMAVLPDGTVVIAQSGELTIAGGGTVATPPGLRAGRVVAAPDGTLVAIGGAVAMGTVAGGLTLTDPGLCVDEWDDVWASSAADVWLSGRRWDPVAGLLVTLAHWDGAAWTALLVDDPAGWLSLAGGGGEVFALGGTTHEVVWVGDAGGLAVDRELFVPVVGRLAIDDATGAVWSASPYNPLLGTYEAGAWVGVPMADPYFRADAIVASGGRVGLAYEDLYVWEDGALTATSGDGYRVWSLAGSDGVLFAAGSNGIDPIVRREAGAGWETLDATGLPAGAAPRTAWADGPDDLWLGFEDGSGGALARWDGVSWAVVVSGLSLPPGALTRESDGQLYFTQSLGAGTHSPSLWTYDGVAASPVPGVDADVRVAHRLADGTWFLSVIDRDANDDLYPAILQQDPGGVWFEALVGDTVLPLVTSDDTAWSATEAIAWTYGPCGP